MSESRRWARAPGAVRAWFIAIGGFALCAACQSLPPTETPGQPSAEVRTEVEAAANQFVAAMERLDADAALRTMAAIPEFRHLDNEGHVMDFETGKRAIHQWFSMASSQKANGKRRDIAVLSRDVALYVWQGTLSVALKDGSRLEAPSYSVSILFKRIDGAWKIVFWQESGEIRSAPKTAGLQP
jgi:hypothetical protein